ncbi:hypothetical protein FACS1894172_15450 [Spirochaetia bacterium]|nr:hypothetical protein FACS1894164_00390 [Spirochaetia bacterium]GHU34744.1 hypothetical protein FACS1894172_15450 [Spirochaetia bacterium]
MKTTKKWNKLFLMGMFGLSLLMAVFTGCASTGAGTADSPGILVITGIPKEYEGKFVSLSKPGLKNDLKSFIASAEKPKDAVGTSTVIKNGEVKLSLYTYKESPIPFVGPTVNGYTGNETGAVGLLINDTAERSYGQPDVIFESVTFENGTANLKWNDAFKTGLITITNIPAEFDDRQASVHIGYRGGNILSVNADISFIMIDIQDGTLVTPKFVRENGVLKSYSGTDKKDIFVSIVMGPRNASLRILPPHKDFLFKAVQITNGKAILDFAKGIEQK